MLSVWKAEDHVVSSRQVEEVREGPDGSPGGDFEDDWRDV